MLKETNISLNEIYAPIEKDLKEFSKILKEQLASPDPLIRDIHEHILKMTGKFLRPALTILCSKTRGTEHPDAVRLGVAVELIHTATLVHDDIIDNSALRRNQPSLHSQWGPDISIIAGDYLYAKAFLLLANLRNIPLSQAFAACAHLMCEGEMKQIERRSGFLMPESEYLKIIHQKTASLFQAACMGGGFFSGASPEDVEKLGQYGFNLGMAFQIVDDCLDLTGQTQSLGKSTGLDLDKNDVTLPLLYLFETLGENDRLELLRELKSPPAGFFKKIRGLAVETQSVARAMDRARGYADEATKNLANLKDSVYKESLSLLTVHCLNRVR